MKELNWWGCYSDSLKGKIVDEAFSHPAKMAWGLIMRIFQHLFDEGWLKEGDLTADCFGGIGVTGLVAASFGCPCILVELEEKFVDLAEQNFELHREQWEKMGKPHPIVLQGDSRQFSSIIREVVDSIITSPPFGQAETRDKTPYSGGRVAVMMKDAYIQSKQGDTEGQIGAMKEGKLDEVVAVITSPPYSSIDRNGVRPNRIANLQAKLARSELLGRESARIAHKGRGSPHEDAMQGSYGQTEGQLGGMPEGDHTEVVDSIITSPPYAESLRSETEEQTRRKQERIAKAKTTHNGRALEKPSPGKAALGGGYGVSEGQLGGMPKGSHEAVVDAVVTSPPWEKTGANLGGVGDTPAMRQQIHDSVKRDEAYGITEGQIGQEQGSTYWEAVSEVYQSCFQALRGGGVMAVVVKAFVRNKKIVDLPSQTLELLEAIGFEPLERIRAWMVSPATQASMMPDVVPPYRKEKKSFFRRLAEKRGSPRIDWEEVLVLQKPH